MLDRDNFPENFIIGWASPQSVTESSNTTVDTTVDITVDKKITEPIKDPITESQNKPTDITIDTRVTESVNSPVNKKSERVLDAFDILPSSDSFKRIADWLYVDETTILKFIPEQVMPGQIVHVKIDFIPKFIQEVYPKILNQFKLVSHTGDYCAPFLDDRFREQVIPLAQSILNDNKLIGWWGQNLVATHPKLHPLPIGLDQRPYNDVFDTGLKWSTFNVDTFKPLVIQRMKEKLNNPNTPTLYINFNCDTNDYCHWHAMAGVRRKLQAKVESIPTLETVPKTKNWGEYLEVLSKYKYALVPPGRGLDTHRLWECYYVGTIPVILDTPINKILNDLPSIVLPNVDLLSEKTLTTLNTSYKVLVKQVEENKYNFDKLFMKYWLNELK